MSRIMNDGKKHLPASDISENQSNLIAERKFDGNRCRLTLAGELRHNNSDFLSNEVIRLFEDGITEVIIDCSDLSYADTVGLQSFVKIYKYVQVHPETSFQLYVTEGYLLDILQTCRFDKLFNITSDEKILEGNWR